MIHGRCHCGDVCFHVNAVPAQLVDCNCSLCRRDGALWGHVPISSVKVEYAAEAVTRYVQGDKTLAVITCNTCGCTTHYENLKQGNELMAVNFRMCDPEVVSGYTVRRFDGATSWKFLD